MPLLPFPSLPGGWSGVFLFGWWVGAGAGFAAGWLRVESKLVVQAMTEIANTSLAKAR